VDTLGNCELFEERQIGGSRYNIFSGCKQATTATIILRGGGEQFIAEMDRSIHDAIMVVKRAIKHHSIVAGGGAIEVCTSPSTYLFHSIPFYSILLVVN
jgi:T-complex protein 1 subunit eta